MGTALLLPCKGVVTATAMANSLQGKIFEKPAIDWQ